MTYDISVRHIGGMSQGWHIGEGARVCGGICSVRLRTRVRVGEGFLFGGLRTGKTNKWMAHNTLIFIGG
jgi:hypothetical protein